ncbi:sulfite exporter TauE/SafE family protein [Maribacter sp. ACAM166]|uniref:sulfite exporter TauE/SafE family protein n=1 Tax=Maribacter sp. ACAM166 TaxID=2508996 RepID=UPI0010FDBB0D|nr:sulfite exporter TauE/SafE family protein [Maribacter sp. ACAM166]TLP80309.1 sulfite exporter TauE/SafE family protein [Maribacter sp. ACAM166]
MIFAALILGFMGSLHCIGMCGPIAFMLPVDRSNNFRKLSQIGIYHFGRLLSYTILGFVFGLLGKGLYVFGLQQKLSILIGVLMIITILLPVRKLNQYNLSKPIYKIISNIKSRLGKALKRKTADTFLTIGFLNGFLPCGLVYMALFGAVAMGNPLQGGGYMLLFGLGTIPLMTTAIYFGGLLKGTRRLKVQKMIPVFVVLIGLIFIIRGLGLGIPYLSPKPVIELVSSDIECHP